MSKALEKIKLRAELLGLKKRSAKKKPKTYNGLDTDADEYKATDLLSEWGTDWFCTRDRNTRERWDIEGTDSHGRFTRLEVKSRVPNDYDTWIIDTYKVDYMLDNFFDDVNYYVNVCDGVFQLYDMNYIRMCPVKKNVRCVMHTGKIEYRDFYSFRKDMFIIDLSTGELGIGAKENESFGTYEN